MSNHEHHKRSIVKAISFRLLIIIANFIIIMAITRRYDIALGVIVISSISSTVFYYIHERIWNKINWGR